MVSKLFTVDSCFKVNIKAKKIIASKKLLKSLTVTDLCVVYHLLSELIPIHRFQPLGSKAWAVVSLADACLRQQAFVCDGYRKKVIAQISKKDLTEKISELFLLIK